MVLIFASDVCSFGTYDPYSMILPPLNRNCIVMASKSPLDLLTRSSKIG